ncbi:hypothetical protein [Paenibacillus sp. GCM10012306]|uniref:hypothetical protein n=1 Tax=Paenibacillus sp. GCM10012306 TaxID=3317342 RepID=UPI003607D049
MNKLLKTFSIILLIFNVGGCGTGSNNQEKIFNDNKRLMDSGDSYTFSSKTGKITEDHAEIKFSGFSGVYTVWSITSDADVTTKININGNAKDDKFKIIQVNEYKELITLWNGEGATELTISIPKGSSAIKWAGKHASGKVMMELETKSEMKIASQKDLFEGDEFFKKD